MSVRIVDSHEQCFGTQTFGSSSLTKSKSYTKLKATVTYTLWKISHRKLSYLKKNEVA